MRLSIILSMFVMGIAWEGCSRQNGTREEELTYLRTVVPESLLEHAHLDIASRESLAIVTEGDSQHLGLHLSPGQNKVHGGIRSEISVNDPFQPGETVAYSWRFKLPQDFVCDVPKNRWWVIGQWHDQPNPQRGETWDNFTSKSPPVLLGLGEVDGKPMLSFSYGPTTGQAPQRVIGLIPLERGKWHRLSLVIHWSQGDDGAATLFMDDSTDPALTAKGPNMNNDYQHYLKLGMYRHPEIDTDNWIYVDDLKIIHETAH